MSIRSAVESLLPQVRAEIRQLQELEAALVALAPTTVTREERARALDVPAELLPQTSEVPAWEPVVALPPLPVPVTVPTASVAVPTVPPAPRRLVSTSWTNAERRAAIVQLLRMRGPMRVAEVARELEAAQGHVQTDMEALVKAGQVTRVDHGTYGVLDVVWSGADRAPLVDVEATAFARRQA